MARDIFNRDAEVQVDEDAVSAAPVEEESETQVEVNEQVHSAPEAVVEPIQVEPEKVVFVPQKDFEGRINQQDFSFTKGTAVKVTRSEANVWVAAEKGYVK